MCLKSGLGVNLSLLPVKVTYFLFFAAIAVLLPYLPVYMKQLGLSPAETAIILSVTTALTGVVRAAVGIVADKLRRHRLIIFICCLIGGIFHFCILFVPPVASGPSPAVTEWKVCCRSTSLALCDGFVFNGSASESSPHSLTVDSSLLDALSRDRLRVCVLRCCGDFGNGIQGSERNSSVAALVTKSSESCRSVADLTMPSLSTVTNCSVGSDRNCDSDFRVALETNEFCMLADRNACFVVCGNVSTSDIRSDQLVPRYQETFILVFVLFFIGQSAFSPIFNLLDGLVYVYLGDKHGEFGKQRLWGTVAFGSFALTSGFIMVALSKYTANNSYLYSFIAFLCLLFMTGLTVYFYKKTPKSSSADGMTKTIRVLLCNFYLVVAYVVMLVAGMIAGDIEAFLFWFLNDLGAEQSVFGVALLVSSVLEAVVLFFSGALIKKFGFSACLYVVFAVYALRLLANSFIENPWVAVATEATQCICFGLLYPAVTSWGSTLTPPGMHGSVQGILGAMYLSIGRAIGAALGGAFYQEYGPRAMFRIFAVFSFTFLLLLILLLETAKWIQRKDSATMAAKVEDVDNLESQTPDTDNRMIREETTEELVGDAAMEEHPQEADASKASEKELESLVSNGT